MQIKQTKSRSKRSRARQLHIGDQLLGRSPPRTLLALFHVVRVELSPGRLRSFPLGTCNSLTMQFAQNCISIHCGRELHKT